MYRLPSNESCRPMGAANARVWQAGRSAHRYVRRHTHQIKPRCSTSDNPCPVACSGREWLLGLLDPMTLLSTVLRGSVRIYCIVSMAGPTVPRFFHHLSLQQDLTIIRPSRQLTRYHMYPFCTYINAYGHVHHHMSRARALGRRRT